MMAEGAADAAREIAPDVFCLGPSGRTQTDVYFVRSGSSWVLVDTGWAKDASRIERAAGSLFGAGSRPAAILLTHVHPDHAGSALDLARSWSCPVYLHPEELPVARGEFAAMVASAGPLDRWVVLPLLRAMGTRRRDAVLGRSSLGVVARAFEPGSGVPGLPGWECIPTPGHTPGHVSYFRPGDRVLISGDALVTVRINSVTGLLMRRPGVSGPPWYTTWNPAAARQSLGRLARLEPAVLAGGHGTPVTDTETAAALAALAAGRQHGHSERAIRDAAARQRNSKGDGPLTDEPSAGLAMPAHRRVGRTRASSHPAAALPLLRPGGERILICRDEVRRTSSARSGLGCEECEPYVRSGRRRRSWRLCISAWHRLRSVTDRW